MIAKPELLSEITHSKSESTKAADIIKSVYAFEFLGLKSKKAASFFLMGKMPTRNPFLKNSIPVICDTTPSTPK
jgi:hypothetical protein